MNNTEQNLYYVFVEHLCKTSNFYDVDAQNILTDLECKLMDLLLELEE